MRLVYLGTPEMAVPPLRALVAAGHEILYVVSGPDRRRGRGSATTPSPVKAAALELGLPVSDRVDDVIGAGAELGVVVAFGKIIRPHVLAAVPMVNLHFSELPRWRGAAPLERAILAGDDHTAVSVMGVEEGLDTGDVYAEQIVPIGPATTLDELRDELVEIGSAMLVEALAQGLSGLPTPRPQVGEPTYAAKLTAQDRHLDWSRPAVELHRVVRIGGAWTTFRGDRFEIVEAEPTATALAPGELHGDEVGTGDGSLRLLTVKRQGKGAVPFRDFAHGARPAAGEPFGA